MRIGMIGLGKMGANMTRRLLNGGHEVVGFDSQQDAVDGVREYGARGASSLKGLVAELGEPRVCWMMVPAGDAVDETIRELLPDLARGDIVVDGGNSNYKDTLRRGEHLSSRGVRYIDAGTSGGVWGLENGYSLMVGGDEDAVEQIRPILETLAPGANQGWGHVGPGGAGHFAKMVHNGIEYGLMQAYAEGFAILDAKKEFALDLHQVAEIWRSGSVIRSWLLDLTAGAFSENPDLEGIAPFVPDSGEGRWTVKEAIDLDIPAPVITLALSQRLQSRLEDSLAHRLLSAMRNQFGGHAVKKT